MIDPIRNIVAGISEINTPDPVLSAALEIAERTAATLHLVCAFEPIGLVAETSSPIGVALPIDLEPYREDLQLQLESQIRALAPKHAPRLKVEIGVPADEILATCQRENADLIIVGASRQGLISRMLLGTTAARVLREAPVPVLVIRASPVLAQRVLLATDLSEFSGEIHETALDVVESLNAGEDPELRSTYVSWRGMEGGLGVEENPIQRQARDELAQFLANRRSRDHQPIGVVRFGEPADEIVAEAADWKADLLVVGTHGRKAPARWLLGSVAEGTIRRAPCNVLVIPVMMAERRDLPVIRQGNMPADAGS